MAHGQSGLQVITHAKKLSSYVMTITQKAPKQFRFSVIGRMQEYVLDIVEELYYKSPPPIRRHAFRDAPCAYQDLHA